ncbi:MAG: hypothetical protein IH886_13230 [Nitrospinae bacterium]|nr:hypothetical protein [Nitrospinota bacterium]MCH8207863.1 hypothetical protein [Nitrospinota bacterium]
MSEESNDLEEQHEKVGDAFRYYRERGLFFLNTVIVFASIVLGWVWASENEILSKEGCCKVVFYLFGMLPLAIAIILGILVQFLIFKGYRLHAHSLLQRFHAELRKGEGQEEAESKAIIQAHYAKAKELFDQSNKIFMPAEKISFVNLFLFLLGFTTIFIFISIQFFKSTG